MFSLESPCGGDSNENEQYTIFNIEKKITLDYPKSAARGLKNKFETAVVNEPSVFEPLKFYFNFAAACRQRLHLLCLYLRRNGNCRLTPPV